MPRIALLKNFTERSGLDIRVVSIYFTINFKWK